MPPNFLRKRPPKIADVQCSRLVFQPGDRIIVRVQVNLDSDQYRKLRKSVQKWAGCEVEVLIINVMIMDLEIQKGAAVGPCPVCGRTAT